MKILKALKNNWHLLVVILAALAFFGGTSFYNLQVRDRDFVKWSSPDETANYIFAKRYGNIGEIKMFEKYNLYADDIIRPRSTRSDHGKVKPVSFLGIILIYGTMVKWWGQGILPFLTPFFGALGIVFFYLLVKEVFGRRNAFISTFLLASFPVYIYYSARSMFHNVLFMSLLIIGLYFLVKMVTREGSRPKTPFFSFFDIKYKYKGWIMAACGGVAMGLALSARTSEALWVLPMLFILWLFNIRKVGVTKLFLVAGFMFLALLPVAHWNQILYGSPLSGGYPEMNRSIHELTGTGGGLIITTIKGKLFALKQGLETVVDTIFYFGFDPDKSWLVFKNYFLKMFPALSVFSFLGLMLFLQFWHKRGRAFWAYLVAYATVSAVLILYYGSWEFHDNPDPNSVTIGNSYTRYWLPVYLGAFPLASFFIIKLGRGIFPVDKGKVCLYRRKDPSTLREYIDSTKKDRLWCLRTSYAVNGIRVITVSLFVFFSLNFVLYGSEEGLIYTAQKARVDESIFQEVLAQTENNAVIITKYHDKLFFPERMVIYGLFDDPAMIERYSMVADHLPLYYFNFSLRDQDLEYLNSKVLKDFDLQLREVTGVTSDFTLYELER